MELNHLCLIQEEGYFISCQNQEGCGWNMSMARDWHASTEMPRDCLTVLKKLHKSTRPSASIILVETIADGARNETIFHLREDSYRKNLVNLGEQLLQNYNNIRRPTIIWKVGHKLKFFLLHSYQMVVVLALWNSRFVKFVNLNYSLNFINYPLAGHWLNGWINLIHLMSGQTYMMPHQMNCHLPLSWMGLGYMKCSSVWLNISLAEMICFSSWWIPTRFWMGAAVGWL